MDDGEEKDKLVSLMHFAAATTYLAGQETVSCNFALSHRSIYLIPKDVGYALKLCSSHGQESRGSTQSP